MFKIARLIKLCTTNKLFELNQVGITIKYVYVYRILIYLLYDHRHIIIRLIKYSTVPN